MFILPKPFYLLFLLIISTIFFLFLIIRLPSISYQTNEYQHLWDFSESKISNNSLNLHQITCFIDGKQKRIPCIQQNDLKEVYLPFNLFLKKQFDLYGETDKKNNSFEYFTSNIPSRLFKNKNKFVIDNGSPIEQFNNVALRPRIKCLKPENGFPMSVQWSSIPYFYPVQILQFGFDYFMRNRTEQRKPIERRLSGEENLLILKSGEKVNFQLFSDLPILLFSAKIKSMNASFELIFEEKNGENRRKVNLEFRQWPNGSEKCVWNLNNDRENKEENLYFAYSLEQNNDFTDFLLDLPIFLLKALHLKNNKNSHFDASNFTPISVIFSGPLELKINSIRQKNFAHKEIFLRVAEWLLKNQDDKGGWPVPIERILNREEEGNKLFLPSGWYNAMAQGHALSLLARAFNATGDERFLMSGEKACALFELPSTKGGIKNQLFGYDWYEEYPTLPTGTFVLNGFIYSLIGLNDFSFYKNFSKKLFFNGMNSLRSLLPLFDTGQRSLYDLRHVQLNGNVRPNIARWDYHSLHITLLDWLYLITKENFLKEMSKRWVEYSNGLQIKHN
ncbi:hypothetical protein ACQ4LE_000038 [Meloidogyne hapla]|uniref:Heparosan-N-sulfate-glucuronate 5-epimerase n=1 Tax=Meloidogyne hapla TaxID=6305 RepID=A0A1I8BK13_MELHA